MDKKELIMGVIAVMEENSKLQEENKILKLEKGLAKAKGVDSITIPTDDSNVRVINLIRPIAFKELFSDYNLRRDAPVGFIKEHDDSATIDIIKFDDWFKKLDGDIVGYDYRQHVFDDVTQNELKAFFKNELKQYYEKKLKDLQEQYAEVCKNYECEEKEEAEDTAGQD